MIRRSGTSTNFGFTLIEMVIIISVIGLISVIGIVSWSGVQTWSQNTTRISELQQWSSTFDLYKTRYASWPAMPTADGPLGPFCLGDFASTSNKCGEYTSSDITKAIVATGATAQGIAATTIRTEFAKIGKVPINSSPNVNQLYIGPYVTYSQSTAAGVSTVTAKLLAILKGSTCPTGTTAESAPPLANGAAGTKTCSITKTLTYGP